MPGMGFKPKPKGSRAFALHSKPHLGSSATPRVLGSLPGSKGNRLPGGDWWLRACLAPRACSEIGSFSCCGGCTFPAHPQNRGMQSCLDHFRGVRGRGKSCHPGRHPEGWAPSQPSLRARPLGGRKQPAALAPRPSLKPSNPGGLGVQPSRDTTTCRHPPPPAPARDPAEPSRKHSPAGRKSARSSGLASLCPAQAPPLAPGASALALSTLFLISFQASPDCL